MKTMQMAGRGNAGDMRRIIEIEQAREFMRLEYGEAHFEVEALRKAKPYRAEEDHVARGIVVKVQHDLARAALRQLNALKAEVTP